MKKIVLKKRYTIVMFLCLLCFCVIFQKFSLAESNVIALSGHGDGSRYSDFRCVYGYDSAIINPFKLIGKSIESIIEELKPQNKFIGWYRGVKKVNCKKTKVSRETFELYFKNSDTTAISIMGLLPMEITLSTDKDSAFVELLKVDKHWLAVYNVNVKQYLDSIDVHHYDDTELSKYRAYKIFKEAYPNL